MVTKCNHGSLKLESVIWGFGQTDLYGGPEGPNTTTLQIMEKVGWRSCLLLDRTQVSGDSLMCGGMLLCFDLQGHRRPESCHTDGLISCLELK